MFWLSTFTLGKNAIKISNQGASELGGQLPTHFSAEVILKIFPLFLSSTRNGNTYVETKEKLILPSMVLYSNEKIFELRHIFQNF
jgi:hypothetical protein